MKTGNCTWLTLLAAFALTLASSAAFADDDDGERPRRPERGEEFREKMLEKFDADGDGKLNEEERAAARDARRARAGERGGDRDRGDRPKKPGGREDGERRGRGGPDGERGPRVDHRAVMALFDMNQDGELDEREIHRAHAAINQIAGRRGEAGRGPGDRGPGGRGGPRGREGAGPDGPPRGDGPRGFGPGFDDDRPRTDRGPRRGGLERGDRRPPEDADAFGPPKVEDDDE